MCLKCFLIQKNENIGLYIIFFLIKRKKTHYEVSEANAMCGRKCDKAGNSFFRHLIWPHPEGIPSRVHFKRCSVCGFGRQNKDELPLSRNIPEGWIEFRAILDFTARNGPGAAFSTG